MSDIHRDDRPALIALALILTAILLLAAISAWSRYQADQQVGQISSEQAQTEYPGNGPVEAEGWSIFTPQDTLAQWIMAAFAVVATGVSAWAVKLVRDGSVRI